MTDLKAEKTAARAAAHAVRAGLPRPGAARMAAAQALAAVGRLHKARIISAYLPIRSEIDPLPAMLALSGLGFGVCVPVIVARGAPLRFRTWRPGAALVAGPFGVEIPAEGDWVEPDALLTPLLAFDRQGWRLGYGGGFYDRTLADLRSRRAVTALGLAFAGQEVAAVPHDATDVRLDAIATEGGLIRTD